MSKLRVIVENGFPYLLAVTQSPDCNIHQSQISVYHRNSVLECLSTDALIPQMERPLSSYLLLFIILYVDKNMCFTITCCVHLVIKYRQFKSFCCYFVFIEFSWQKYAFFYQKNSVCYYVTFEVNISWFFLFEYDVKNSPIDRISQE